MAVHLLKPALRAQDVYDFQTRQSKFMTTYHGKTAYPVWTSRKPKRADEMLEGGSVYWVVKKAIQCRQDIWGIEEIQEDGEKPSYLIFCSPTLIRTEAYAKKPFQGWRYLEPTLAPPDIGEIQKGDQNEAPPAEIAQALRQAGLL